MDLIRIIGTTGVEGKGDNQFAQPRGIWIDVNYKEIYVCDCNNHRISVFSSVTLAHIRQIGRGIQGTSLGCLNYAVGLCLDDSKHIYVADTNNHRIAVFHQLTGAQINTIGSQGNTPGRLSSPYGVCVDNSTGSLFVADYENHRIQIFNKDTGVYERMIGSYGSEPGQFNKPIVTCVDEDNGNLFVCDYANNRVQVFNKDTGVYIRQLGNGSSGLGSDALQGPRGICLDRGSKLLFIADRENNRIQIYNKNTFTFIRHFGVGPGLAPGQFNKPMELCVNPDDGTLLVVDGYNHRVQIIPIPELQVERLRIQKEKKEKFEREAKEKRRPRASSKAISTNLEDFIVVDTNPITSHFTVHFNGAGRLFDIVVTQEEMNILNSKSKKKISSLPSKNTTVNEADSVLCKDYQIIEDQSKLFLSLISNLSQHPNPTKYLVPSVLALHALLERQWKPIEFSTQNYSTFLNLLFNANNGTTSTSEKICVINAILSILTATMELSSSSALVPYDNVAETMFQMLISEFSKHLVEYTAEYQASLTSIDNKHKTNNVADLNIILAALSMLSNIFIYEWFHISSIKNNNSKSEIDTKIKNYSRNATNLIFGATFTSSIQKCLSSNPSIRPSSFEDEPSTSTDVNIFMKLAFEVLPFLEIALLAARGRRKKTLTEKIQIELFKKAKMHLEKAKNEYVLITKVIESKYGNPSAATSRGGRNIWRPSERLKVGDLVDAIDKENNWYESYITNIYPAGVRVHFMGWGSKWDDDISERDLHKRIAPLNTKTKNWRGELFEGGLIEIKCNEDMVNQKWMWGRIVLLSFEEGWVEISYSFANETSIIKRADLYGETICPVGMHTKDRSKVANATVVKPMTKVEDLIQQKSNNLPSDEQELFLDRNDAFKDGQLGNGLFNCITNVESNNECFNSDSCPSLISSLENCCIEDIISNISITAFEILMKEVSQVFTISIENNDMVDTEAYKLASDILSILATSPFQQLLVTCFCRVVIVQCGIRAKILATDFLEKNHSIAANMIDNMPSMHVFIEKLCQLEEKYISLIMKSIGNLLEISILKILIERIKVTVTSCSILPIMSAMMSASSNLACLKNAIASCFLDTDRFAASSKTLRKFLIHLFRISTLNDMLKIRELWIDVVNDRVIELCTQFYENKCAKASGIIDANTLLTELIILLSKSRSISRLEFFNTHGCEMASELAFIKAFSNMSSSSNLIVVRYHLLQSMVSTISSIVINKSNESIKKNNDNLDIIIDFINVVVTENCYLDFTELYEKSLTQRLLQTNAINNTESELLILNLLPSMVKCHRMVKEIQETKYCMQAFRKYYLKEYDSNDNDSDDETLSSLLLDSKGFNVHVITPSNWPSSSLLTSSLLKFSTLALPYDFQDMIREFEKYFNSTGGNKRLNWCHGVSTVTLKCNIWGNKYTNIIVNTVQAALLMNFSYDDCIPLTTLCDTLNLSVNTIIEMISSLSNNSVHILECDDKYVRLSTSFLNGKLGINNDTPIELLPNESNKNCKVDSTWRMNVIESLILRTLKNIAKNKSGFFVNYESRLVDTALGPTNIHKEIQKSSNSKNYHIATDDIMICCERLATLGYIDKIKGSSKHVELYGYSYVALAPNNSKIAGSTYTYAKNINKNSNSNEALWNFTQSLSSRILLMKYPDFKYGRESLFDDSDDFSLIDTKTSLNCICDIQKQLMYSLIRVISQIYQSSSSSSTTKKAASITSTTSSLKSDINISNILDKLKLNAGNTLSNTSILMRIEKTILNCLPANTMMIIISLFQNLKAIANDDRIDSHKDKNLSSSSLSFNARWESSTSLSLSFSSLWDSPIVLSRKNAIEGKYSSLPIRIAKELFLFAFENKRAFNEEFHESKVTQLTRDIAVGEDDDKVSFTFKDLLMAILRVASKVMYDSDDDDDDNDEYNIIDDNNIYNVDDDDEEEHISKLINTNSNSSRIHHNRHHHHHYHQNDLSFLSQAELNFFTGANRFNRTNNTNINTSSSDSRSSSSSNRSSSSSSSSSSVSNSNNNSRSNSISHIKEISFPKGLSRLHRDGPRVDDLIQKNKKFSMDDKNYTLKDSLLFTLQHLNSSILFLLENDHSNSTSTILDDDSLSELLLDLYDDILISISDNDKCSNDDSIENHKHNDDNNDNNNNINFRNISKKIFEEFDIDPIIGIERFKFDVGIDTNNNSSSNHDYNDKKNELNYSGTNCNNDHIIDINASIKLIIEILPMLSPSLSLRLLSHYHWDINTLIDDYTINNITTNKVQSFKIKGDNSNEKCSCNCCYNYNHHSDMFSLTCGHYFCRSCWSNSINKIDTDISCKCLHNYCSISLTSDFIDAIVGVGHEASSIVLDNEISLLSSSHDMYLKYHYDNYPNNSDKLLSFQKSINCDDPDICVTCSSPYHYPATCVMMLHWSSKSMSSHNGFTCQTASSPHSPNNKSGNVSPNRSTSSNPFLHTPSTPNRDGYLLSNPPYRDLFQSYLDFYTSANGKIAELLSELGLINDSEMSNSMRKQDSDSIAYARISLSSWQVISLSSRFLAYVQVFLNYHQSIPLLLQLSLLSFQESVSKLYIMINHTTWDKDKDKNKIYETINAIKKRLFILHTSFFSNQ